MDESKGRALVFSIIFITIFFIVSIPIEKDYKENLENEQERRDGIGVLWDECNAINKNETSYWDCIEANDIEGQYHDKHLQYDREAYIDNQYTNPDNERFLIYVYGVVIVGGVISGILMIVSEIIYKDHLRGLRFNKKHMHDYKCEARWGECPEMKRLQDELGFKVKW